jgi:diguanylate cyclase (GGDEF)-like protein
MAVFEEKTFQKLLASENWQNSIAGFSKLRGFTVKCISAEGRVIGRSFEERRLCRLIRGSEKGLKRCRSQCGRKIAQSIREDKPVIFTCYAGLLCFCTPLKAEGRVAGAIFGGKVLRDAPVLSRYVRMADALGVDHDLMFKALAELRIAKVRELKQAMSYLRTIAEALITHFVRGRQYGRGMSRLFTLFHLGNDLNMVADSHELYGLIVNSLAILFDLPGCSLLLENESGTRVQTHSCCGPAPWGLSAFSSGTDEGIVGQVYRTHDPVYSEERMQLDQSGFSEQIRSVHAFPLHAGSKMEGLICLFNATMKEDEVRMVRAFLNQVAVAVQNVELRKKVEHRIVEISNLGLLTTEVGEVREIEKLLQLIMNRSTELVRAEQASLMLLDDATEELHIRACRGLSHEVASKLRVPLGEGIAGKVLADGQPLLVKDIERDPRVRQKQKMRYRTKSFISLPLSLRGRNIGVLNIADKAAGGTFSEEDVKILNIFATQALIALERTQLYERSKEMEHVLITDHLTGLLNRRYFFERTAEEITRAERHHHPLSLMMIDVDDFKWYNDHNGHLAGDDALRTAATLIRDTVRNIDFVARYGGEEFVVVLPQTSKKEAIIIGERLRTEVETFYFPSEENQPLGKMTISIGLATYPDDARNIKALIAAADKALYRAKATGKNRMVLFKQYADDPD